MPRIVWDEKYDVKVARINKEHQTLFDLINELNDAMMEGKGQDIIGDTIEGLRNYAKFHFGTEEALMRQTSYHDYEQHKYQHDKFIEKVEEFKDKHNKKVVLISLDVMKFLVDWLINHIMKIDKAYSQHFNSNGII